MSASDVVDILVRKGQLHILGVWPNRHIGWIRDEAGNTVVNYVVDDGSHFPGPYWLVPAHSYAVIDVTDEVNRKTAKFVLLDPKRTYMPYGKVVAICRDASEVRWFAVPRPHSMLYARCGNLHLTIFGKGLYTVHNTLPMADFTVAFCYGVVDANVLYPDTDTSVRTIRSTVGVV